MWSHVLDFISHPVFGIVLTILVLVAGWKMTASGANALLIVAWVIFVGYTFFTGPLPHLELFPRFLWTLLVASGFGLGIYYTLWTNKNFIVVTPPQTQATSSRVSLNITDLKIGRSGEHSFKWEFTYAIFHKPIPPRFFP